MKILSLKTMAMVVALIAALFGTASPSSATSGWKWTMDSNYGDQGMDIIGSGTTVSDLISHYLPPNNDYLTNHEWRFIVSAYHCDPRGQSKTACPVVQYFPGKSRVGNPPTGGTTCTTIGGEGGNVSWCQNYGLASAYVSHGDFPNFPGQFRSGTWLCSEIEINSNSSGTGTWYYNANSGLRACAQILA